MGLKRLLVPVITLEADQAALQLAGTLAGEHGARISALVVAVWAGSEFAEVEASLSDALMDLIKGRSIAAAQERARIVGWIEQKQLQCELCDVSAEVGIGRDEVVTHARVADLVVLAQSDLHDRARRELIEDVLMKSGRPLLLAPQSMSASHRLERILIAWNGSAESTRAVTAALPLLQRAKSVRVGTIDAASRWASRGRVPGRDLAEYLAAHGVAAEVVNLDGLGREHARALADAAADFDADLIVMGAYGHSRAREIVMGGVTRDLIRSSRTPLLLAH